MREKNRKSIASIGKFPQFTIMNVINGQAGVVIYSSLIFYSLTIDNILNIIVLLILAGISIMMLTGENGILQRAGEAGEKTQTAQEEELRTLTQMEAATNLENTKHTDDSTGEPKTVTIPAGFAVSQVEGENTIADGLVIIDKNGNEFVWVPVTDINEMAQCSKTDGDCILKLENSEIVCTTHSNNSEIVGKLYATSTGNNFDASTPNTMYDPNNGLREPAIITNNSDGTGNSLDGDTENLSIINEILGTNYTTSNAYLLDMKKDYYEMIKSVEKYDGFYISRYEISKDSNNKAASIEGTPLVNDSNNMWYGLYAYGKTYNTNSVASSMIWGSQYDAMMRWMYNNGIGTNIKEDIGDNRNKFKTTGAKKDTDVINNVYDLYGCHYEFTLEATTTSVRVHRGRKS